MSAFSTGSGMYRLSIQAIARCLQGCVAETLHPSSTAGGPLGRIYHILRRCVHVQVHPAGRLRVGV